MKTNNQKKWLTILTMLVMFLVASCKKDAKINDITNETITSSIFGRVTDENGNSISGATASAGGKSTTTDLNGVFKLSNVTLNKKHAFVKINKSGYFDGSRTFIATSGKTNQVEIQLFSKSLKGSFDASTGATINVTANASVEFPANAIKKADGTIYTGTVKVFAAYLNPTDEKLYLKMPGDLIGTRTDNSESLLRSFGMMNVELEDASGNKLNIADGKEATLSMSVPATLLNAATATIPLWYFDTNTGVWKEEGTATLTGNKYIGNVKHFSWWNCDTPNPEHTVCLRLVDQNGNPLAGVEVFLITQGQNWGTHGYTDNNGEGCGLVTANSVIELKIRDNCDNNLIFIQNIGPFAPNTAPTDLGNIQVNFPTNQITGSYQGKLMDCNSNAVSNGYVIYTYNGSEHYVPADANGNFNFNIVSCGTTLPITFIGYDLGGGKFSVEQTITYSYGSHDIGNVIVCEAPQEFVQFQMDGGSMINFFPPNSSLNFSLTRDTSSSARYSSISAYTFSPTYTYLYFYTNNEVTSVGNYTLSSFRYSKNNINYSSNTPTGLTTVITNYPAAIGEYYEGYVNGNFIDATTQTPHTINCTYRIKRTQ